MWSIKIRRFGEKKLAAPPPLEYAPFRDPPGGPKLGPISSLIALVLVSNSPLRNAKVLFLRIIKFLPVCWQVCDVRILSNPPPRVGSNKAGRNINRRAREILWNFYFLFRLFILDYAFVTRLWPIKGGGWPPPTMKSCCRPLYSWLTRYSIDWVVKLVI